MQITVQMLDGSITPFKVRSSITIASLKAKFEPWQPMKGRALLHHDVQLDDRATLSSIPGIKNGTILRVDKHVSQVKNRATGKKSVMSGPASSAVDEDVMESIEASGDDEETSNEHERRISGSKRKRPSRSSAAAVEDSANNDDNDLPNSSRGMILPLGDMSENPLNLADTTPSNSAMSLRFVKKERRETPAHQQIAASETQNAGHRLHSLNNILAPPLKYPTGNPTASTLVPQNSEAVSSHQDLMEVEDATFLSGINAAAAETEKLPPHSEAGSDQIISADRCHACGRACGCGGGPLALSSSMAPAVEATRGQEATSTNSSSGDSKDHLNVRRNPTSQRAESSWTGM